MIKNLLVISVFFCICLSCVPTEKSKAESLYHNHCSSCHIAPSPKDLPKDLWKKSVLPEMAARMGIKDSTYSPYSGYSFREQEAMMKSGIYTVEPQMDHLEWQRLKDYVLDQAPDSLPGLAFGNISNELTKFKVQPIELDSISGATVSFLEVDKNTGGIYVGDLLGNVLKYNYSEGRTEERDNFQRAITSYTKIDSTQFVTLVGILDPSEIAKGKIFKIDKTNFLEIADSLHRPVHSLVEDLDNDGEKELLISEFGNLRGQLRLIYKDQDKYGQRMLLGRPGIIRTIVRDIDKDGKKDIVALGSQGNEGITILYQTDNLKFRSEQVLRFSPVYGSSWFDLVDYDGDGFDDIITVQGDNADRTYVHKPYHGLRIFLNDGTNEFEESFFYPLYGATRFSAADFDKDGDLDLGVVAAFPNYGEYPDLSFLYLENIDSKKFGFKAYKLRNQSLGRWLFVDSGDVDQDGDEDMVLGAFSYHFTAVPDSLSSQWKNSKVDLLVLENTLN